MAISSRSNAFRVELCGSNNQRTPTPTKSSPSAQSSVSSDANYSVTATLPALTPTFSLRAALSGVKQGISRRLGSAIAKFASYDAASPTATTRVGGRMGSNNNSTIASLQRVGMNWTAEDVSKNSSIAKAYLDQRVNYCSSQLTYIPSTGDPAIDQLVRVYLHGEDGYGGVFGNMGVACSMRDAFSRTADIETPVRGDAGMIWYDDGDQMRLMEFSADQLGEIYNFAPPRACGLGRNNQGEIIETCERDCVYFGGRYFRGCDCVAFKIYERTNSFYACPRIYQASDVIYFNDPAEFRGVRGVTKFATAIRHMEKGETLFQTGMDAALRQAKTAMVIFNNRGQPDEQDFDSSNNWDGTVTYRERIPNGPIDEYYYNGDEVRFTSPDSPGPELIQGVETSDERVALALGVNYAFLISANKTGGAASRLEVNKAAKEMSRIQNNIHRPRLRVISYVAIMDGVRRGHLPLYTNITKGRWMLPISPIVDAGYEADENIDYMRAGLEAPQDLIAETNRDACDVLAKKGEWAEMVAREAFKRNKNLAADGIPATITTEDLAQTSDNPQNQAAATNIVEGKPATGALPAKAA